MPSSNEQVFYLAGTFRKFWAAQRATSFWIRRHPDKCIRINRQNFDYDYLMIEVDDPATEIARINAWVQPAS